ncbi:MAG: hypothetical protein JXB32_03465 [Deltaproteobacteria bacterium]|nr:hypothetical protein [Deltaproteobacteria bacterium]
MTFTTPTAPTVTTTAATSVTNSTAYLNGTANPNRAAATGYFRYATTDPGTCNDTFGSRAPVSGGTALGSGSSAVSYSRYVSGLSSGTTYYYCAIAVNSEGTSFGAVLSFTTLGAPTVTTTAATSVSATAATLNGSANPNGNAAYGYFRYAPTDPGTCSDSFGTRAPSSSGSDTYLGAGTTAVGYARTLSGLTPGTTYYYCAIARNSYGTSFGLVLSFTTPTAAPTVTTNTPSPVAGTTATLNGTANPGGAATTGWFRYSTVSPGTCNDSFGTRAPAAGGSALGSGTTAVAFSQAITGLSPATTYYACAIAQNSAGTSFGAVLTFTTPTAPTVTTTAATSVTNTAAYLNGTANPNRAATTGYFRYGTTNPGTCNDSFGSRAPVTGGTALGSGSSAVAYSQYVSSLSPGTTYYYCAIAANGEGTSFGAVLSFTTLAAPTVTTGAATSVSATAATLNGAANPNGNAAYAYFRYATTDPGACNDSFGTRAPSSSGSDTYLGAGTTDVAFSRSITGLTPGTTYYYCAIGRNAYGTSFGAVLSFTALAAAPTVTTSAATGVTTTTATLNGTANPNGASTTGWFRIDTVSPGTCNDTFGTRLPSSGGSALGSGNSAVAFSQSVPGVTPGTTYYFCAVASNSVGVAFGTVRTFTTPAAPTVNTLAATPVTSVSATLNASVNPNGYATTGWFRFGTTSPGTCNDTFGTRVPVTGGTGLGSGAAFVSLSQPVSGLAPATTYYFCALASSSIGTTLGEVLSFTTPNTQPSVTTLAASGIAPTAATLNGSANPNGDPSTGWFRWSAVNPGTCNDSFGTRAPASGGTALGSGNTPVPFSTPLSGLTTGVTYYFCALASNGIGVSLGALLTFTTSDVPTVTSLPATGVSGTAATLNGSANPNLLATTGWFRYATTNPGSCNDTFGVRTPATGGSSLGAGSSAVSYSQPLAGLVPGTTYYYCAVASSAVGLGFGSVLTFTTADAPTVATEAASGVSGTVATLHGTADPNLAATTGWFRYAATDPGACNDTFGVRTPATGGSALGAGDSPVPFSAALSGLASGATYYYCAIAQNAQGTSLGAVLSFTTSGAPAVTTGPATAISATTATLAGSANPNLTDSTGWFRYATTSPGTCNDAFGVRVPTTGGTPLGAGDAPVPFSASLAGLTPGTTYYFCAVAQNSLGTRFGAVLSFTTLAPPAVTTAAATDLSGTGATLHGSANPNLVDTTAWFRFSTVSPGVCNDTFGTRIGGAALGAGSSAVPFAEPLSGLVPGTTYHFCAIASSAVGTSFGALLSFTTPAVPTVTTGAATGVSSTAATLNGTANPHGAAATGWFRYAAADPGACNDSFGTRVGGDSLGAGSSAVAFSHMLSGLAPGTTYYYCAIAQNTLGTGFGTVLSFTMPAPPEVTTLAATGLSSAGATLEASVDPNASDTIGWFRYAATSPGTCNDSFGTRAPAAGGTALGAGSSPVALSEPLAGLTPGTTYYFCAIASNAVGTSVGSVVSFTTPTTPSVTTEPATDVTSGGATLHGTANPNGSDATGWFRFATTDPGACDDSFGTRAPLTGGTALGAGTATVEFTFALGALTPATTYYYCAIVSNSIGAEYGAVLSFTTTGPPTVVTEAATEVGVAGATLHASADPNGVETAGWFRYATTDPVVCDDAFGTRVPAADGSALGAGTDPVPYAETLAGLEAGTTYYYCALAANAQGTGLGSVLSFTTPGEPTAPAVTTEPATDVTGTTATLNGSAAPNGAEATGWFRYSATDPVACDDTFGTRAPATDGTALGADYGVVAFGETLEGLAPATTYYYCALASNAVGTSFGELLTLTTGVAPPVVSTTAPTDVEDDSAVLNGSAVPNGDATIGWFRYDTTDPETCDDAFGTRVPAAGGTAVGDGTEPVAFSELVWDLATGTVYYYCAVAENSEGLAFGEVVSFAPGAAPPTVTTEPATGVEGSGATLHGTANPNGTETTGWFRYGDHEPAACDDAFGTRAPATGGAALGAGTEASPFEETLNGLEPNLTYFYCAAASNLGGATFGELRSFTTPPLPPTVRTIAPEVAADGTVTLHGVADPRGSESTAWFRTDSAEPAACDDSFGVRWPAEGGSALGAGRAEVAFSELAADLAPGDYWVCALGSNEAGTAYGELLAFTVPEPEVPPPSDGCGCRVPSRSRGLAALLLLALPALVLALRRRRRR